MSNEDGLKHDREFTAEERAKLNDLLELSPDEIRDVKLMAQVARDMRGTIRMVGWLGRAFQMLILGLALAIAFNWEDVKRRFLS